MAIKPIVALVETFYSPSSFTVVEQTSDFLVKFYGVDFSAPSEQTTRADFIDALYEQGYSLEEDFTDLIILKAGG